MMNTFKTTFVAAAITAASTISAAAATLSLVGTGYDTKALTGSYDLAVGGGGSVEFLTGAVKDGTNGLSLSGPGKIAYTYIGSDAGNTNFSLGEAGSPQFSQLSAINSVSGPFDVLGGLLDFAFQTTLPSYNGSTIFNNAGAVKTLGTDLTTFAIGYKLAENGQSAFLYFDDVATGDRDFDDFVVRVNVIPLPAGGVLLLTALGGIAALRRRKSA